MYFLRNRKPTTSGERGFGLVELLVVVAILGVLALIAIPVFGAVQNSGKEAVVMADLRTAGQTIETLQQDGKSLNAITLAKEYKLRFSDRENYYRASANSNNSYSLICATNDGNFAIMVRTATDKGYIYRPGRGIEEYPPFVASGSQSVLCPEAGVQSPTGNLWSQNSTGTNTWFVHS